ncbi:serine/threonine-protein phosphatase 4 regulatory subunit 2-like [Mangifera indica]|uniref:serine/threonine-protein phosphatase 4 regulatory subunit 2-like n=1 Tax=Mangifera indica TaxID=29780 RepID=UPI001CFB079C|nr:serine/threonine-protein phosphatase 4 regulatory subunit 2-like [Mangifera indica]
MASKEGTLQSVDEHHPVDQQHPVEQEHSVDQQHLVDQEHSVEKEHVVDKEHSVDQERLVDHIHDKMDADVLNHGVSEPNPDFNEEEVRRTLEVIASSGKFWHDWDKLKSMLSFQLKQVLLEYPESKMTTEQQTASVGETYPELLKRLDEALLSFDEGPPFTLQRLCEILLAARSIYPKLSKLVLALEKNLSVTSTLTICTDPYPQAMIQTPNEAEKPSEELHLQSNSIQNGVEPIVEDRDEVMAEVEQGDIDDEMAIDMEALEEIVGSSETDATPTTNS